jgi:ribonuclease G
MTTSIQGMALPRLVLARHENLLCVARETSAGITDLYAAAVDGADYTGAVVQAQVTRVMTGQGAAIVRGTFGEAYWSDAAAKNAQSGDTVKLQIKSKAAVDKLPQASRDIALTGRFLVHLPAGKGVKRSRHNANAAMPDCLAKMSGGWVVRRAATQANAEQLAQEAQYLSALGQQQEVPALTIWQRAVIEHGVGLQSVVVENALQQRMIQKWLADFAPDYVPLVVCAAEAVDWDALMAEATAPTVSLMDGASLTLEQTRAFWAVDVDAGAATNHLQVNMNAARALARQLRLRNIGGIVVVDFINLPRVGERDQLLAALRQAVADDPAGVEVFGLSKLGLLELTRTRRGACLADCVCE